MTEKYTALRGDFCLTPFAMKRFEAERRRQLNSEGWSYEHDDAHEAGELLRAGICYYMHAKHGYSPDAAKYADVTPYNWPWGKQWWKPKGPLRDLERAGALALAERERELRKSLNAYVGHCDQKLELFADMYAELIVTAVNSQASLLKALEGATAALDREEKYLIDMVHDEEVGGVMQGDVEGAFHRIRSALSPLQEESK